MECAHPALAKHMQMQFRVDVFNFGEHALRHGPDCVGIFGGNDHPQAFIALAVALGLGISDKTRQKAWKAINASNILNIDQQSVADEQPFDNGILAQNVGIFLIVDLVEYALRTLASQCVPDKVLGCFMVKSGCH